MSANSRERFSRPIFWGKKIQIQGPSFKNLAYTQKRAWNACTDWLSSLSKYKSGFVKIYEELLDVETCVHLLNLWPMRTYILKARRIGDADGEVMNRSQVVKLECERLSRKHLPVVKDINPQYLISAQYLISTDSPSRHCIDEWCSRITPNSSDISTWRRQYQDAVGFITDLYFNVKDREFTNYGFLLLLVVSGWVDVWSSLWIPSGFSHSHHVCLTSVV